MLESASIDLRYADIEPDVDQDSENEESRNQEVDEFGGICKRDPSYEAEKGLKCFRDHNICR